MRPRAGGHARLLGLRIFEATGTDIADLGEEHGYRVLRVCGKGTKVALIPLPPAVARAIDRSVGSRTHGPVLLDSRGARMDRHAATRRLGRLADNAGVRITRPHPQMLRHTFVTTMLDAGVDLRDVQIAARHADPRTTMRYDPGPQEPGPPPELRPGRLHGLRHLTETPFIAEERAIAGWCARPHSACWAFGQRPPSGGGGPPPVT